MRVTIEDLEALKELNDELEENHVEVERSLHEEIGIYGGNGVNIRAVLITTFRNEGYSDPRT